MKKYVLMSTDGYSIDMTPYGTIEEARDAMKKAYELLTPKENDESSEEMSSLCEDGAILYANGENVYVWDIQPVSFEPIQEYYMSENQMHELLTQIVNHVCVDKNTNESIEALVNMGFDMNALKYDFDFSEGDLMDYAEYCEELNEERE